MQVPSNMLIDRISRPSVYIGIAVSDAADLQTPTGQITHLPLFGKMVIWGLISNLIGRVQSFGGMVAIRFLL